MNAKKINDAINRAGNNSLRRAALMTQLMLELEYHCTDDVISEIAVSINSEASRLAAYELQKARDAKAAAKYQMERKIALYNAACEAVDNHMKGKGQSAMKTEKRFTVDHYAVLDNGVKFHGFVGFSTAQKVCDKLNSVFEEPQSRHTK